MLLVEVLCPASLAHLLDSACAGPKSGLCVTPVQDALVDFADHYQEVMVNGFCGLQKESAHLANLVSYNEVDPAS